MVTLWKPYSSKFYSKLISSVKLFIKAKIIIKKIITLGASFYNVLTDARNVHHYEFQYN